VSPGEAEAAVPSMGHVGDDNGASPAPSWGGGFDDGPAYSDDYHQDPIEASQEHQGPHNAPGSVSRGSAPALDLAAVPRSTISGDAPSFGGDVDGSSGSGVPGYARDGFTARTKVVLEHLQHRFGPSSGSKRRHPASATPGPAADPIALDGIVAGKSRLEACRWFFEALVLRNKGYVDLEQAEPYGEIAIRPLQQLMDGGPVPGTSARPTPASAFPSQGE